MSLFGGADRNAQARRQEYADYYKALDIHRQQEKINKENYRIAREQHYDDIKYQENNLRYQEKGLVQGYESAVEMQDFEYDTARRAYEKSREQADRQKDFNNVAAAASREEQDLKLKEDLLSIMFEESETFLNHAAESSGLSQTKQNRLTTSLFDEARSTNTYNARIGEYELDRRKKRSESQVEAQKQVLKGMKAAGAIRARGGSGRSTAKAALAVMAESGAMKAAISNGLMYAEDSIDLGIAQLKDMLILEQTMVTAARDQAINDYDLKTTTLDSKLKIDNQKINASRHSAKERDAMVRKKILQQIYQADLNAEASVYLMPERLPELKDPRELYGEFDNPDTEDYQEILIRPRIQEFPDYVPIPPPDYERDFHYSRGREDVAMSNITDGLKIAGTVAGVASGIGTFASLGTFGAGAGVLGQTGFLATNAATLGTISTSMGQLGNSFYPQTQQTRYSRY